MICMYSNCLVGQPGQRKYSAIWERGGALKPFRWLGPPGVLPLAASAHVIGLDGGASVALVPLSG
jgi:hypothetical protein